MKTKFSTRSPLARRSLREGGFFNIRTLLGLTLCFSGLALAIIAGRDTALRSVSKPDRYMPVPGANSRDEATRLAELEQYWQDRLTRSEERRVGKECRSRGSPAHYRDKRRELE